MTRNDEISVLFCSNRAYCQHMAAAIASMLVNNPRHTFRIYAVITEPAPDESRRLAELVNRFPNALLQLKAFDRDRVRTFHADRHITVDTYVRIFLSEFLDEDTERVLYLDCDLIICSDLAPLWHADMGEHVISAVRGLSFSRVEAQGSQKSEADFNAGVLLIDVNKWKSMGVAQRMLDYIVANGANLYYHDQDALNAVLRGHIGSLPLKWNFTPRHVDAGPALCGVTPNEFASFRSKPGIVHFAGLKPWLNHTHYKSAYDRYRALTPWAHDLVQPSAAHAPAKAFAKDAVDRSKTWVKWHMPGMCRLLRNWTGMGDPTLQQPSQHTTRTA